MILDKKLIKKIHKNKSLFIIGRGPSSRFYKNHKNHVSIGFNVKEINNIKLTKFYKKNTFKKNNIKVGSVNFELESLLTFINSKINKKINVFLFGFDFRKISNDDDIEKKKINKSKLQQLIDVNSQQMAFTYIKNSFKKLNIYRMGFSINDDLNPKKFNFIKKIEKNDLKKSDLKIVAEITTNHKGDTTILEKLILGCIQSKVSNIKFQKRDYLNFYSKNKLNSEYKTPISNTFAEYRKKLELNFEQIDLIKFYEKKYNLNIIFSALDFSSYYSLKKMGFKNFKIPSTISNHKKFIKEMSEQKLSQIIISTGMTDEKYVKFILEYFKKFRKIYLLHAVSSYPTFFTNMNLNIIHKYKKLSHEYKNIIPGYSSHDIGNLGSMLAIASGARMIEKHIKFGVTDWMHFDDTAIDVNSELPFFVNDLIKVDKSMGSELKKVYEFEHHKYSKTKI